MKRASGQAEAPDTQVDGAAVKRRKTQQVGAGDQIAFCVASPSPLAPKLPMWTDSKGTTPVAPDRTCSGVCLSLNQWAHQQLHDNSLSLNVLNCAPGSDCEDTDDTATSSCSSSSIDSADSTASQGGAGATAVATASAASAAAAAEDEGDSQQPRAQPAAVFSFGQRACVAPDLAGSFEQWEVVETLLALGQIC